MGSEGGGDTHWGSTDVDAVLMGHDRHIRDCLLERVQDARVQVTVGGADTEGDTEWYEKSVRSES